MAITGSPDIFVSEQDLSTYVGNMDVTTAAIAGDFTWGPAGEVVRVANEARLKAMFGAPVDRNYKDWFTAKNYLEYSNSLAVSRVVLDSAKNAYFIPQSAYIPVHMTDEEVAAAAATAAAEGRDPSKIEDFPWKAPEIYSTRIQTATEDEIKYQQHLLKIGEYSGKARDLDTVAQEVKDALAERIFYTPITEDQSLEINEDGAIQNATVTSFPNYVAYTNGEGVYSIGKTSRQLYDSYKATPQNLMDLVPLNAGYTVPENDEGEETSEGPQLSVPHLGEIRSETLDDIGICSVIACYNEPAEGQPKIYYYLRKKYLNKFYKIVPDPDVPEGQPKKYIIEFIPGNGSDPSYGWYATEGYGMNWGYKYAEEKGLYHKKIPGRTDSNGEAIYLDATYDSNDNNAEWKTKLYIESGTLKLNVKNASDYQIQSQSIGNNEILAMAKYPGEYGNRVHVCVLNKPAYDAYKKVEKFKRDVSSLTSVTRNKLLDYLGNKVFEDDSIAVATFLWNETFEILELKEYGIFSLTPGSLDITGYDNYVFNFFSQQSNYVNLNKQAFEKVYGTKDLTKAWINIDTTLMNGMDYDPLELGGNDALYSDVITTNSNGVDYDIDSTATTVVTEKDYIKPYTPIINLVGGVGAYKKAWDLFKNEESDNTQVQLLMQAGGSAEIGQYIIDLAERRKDCLACVSPSLSECVNVTDPCDRIANGTGNFYSKSSYAFMDGNYKYQYDSYNDVYRWVPLNGDMAGLFAYVDAAEEPWMSIGGRQLRNCIKLAFYPSKADRDILFNAGVNAVTNFASEGNVVWGDWTRVTNSAFNFVGVRRCFLHIERNIIQYARKIMWKQNDQITRDQFVLAITPFLDSIVGGRGLQEYGIYAGADVTSTDEMDRGIFRAKIACKPVRSIRYVDLVFSAIRSDMSISEVVS